jgi:predicted phosphate transport protein (TIGR00153 family)
MFSGETEVQAKRKTLSVMQDEARRVLDAARSLTNAYSALLTNDQTTLHKLVDKITKDEEEVEGLRRILTRELAEIGTMIMNREDMLRAAYDIEEIGGYITSIAFRFTNVKTQSLKKLGLVNEITAIIEIAVEMTQRLNEVVRALTINPTVAIDLANSVQKLEREMDIRFRTLMVKVMNEVDSAKDIIVLHDILGRIEGLADRCQTAADSVTIIALGL